MKKKVLYLLVALLSVGAGYNYVYGDLGKLIKKAAKKVRKVAKKAVKEVKKTGKKAVKGAKKTVKEIGEGDIKGAAKAAGKTVATTATTAAKGVASVSKTGFNEFKDTFEQIGDCAKVVGLGTAWAAQKGTYEATKVAFTAAQKTLDATETSTKGVMTAISKVSDVAGIVLTKYFVLEEVSLKIDVAKMLPPQVQLPIFKLKGSVFGKKFNVNVDWDGDDVSVLAKKAIKAISKIIPLDDLLKNSPIKIKLGKKKKKKKGTKEVVVVDETAVDYDPALYDDSFDINDYDEYYDLDYGDGTEPEEPTDPDSTTEQFWDAEEPDISWDGELDTTSDSSGAEYDPTTFPGMITQTTATGGTVIPNIGKPTLQPAAVSKPVVPVQAPATQPVVLTAPAAVTTSAGVDYMKSNVAPTPSAAKKKTRSSKLR